MDCTVILTDGYGQRTIVFGFIVVSKIYRSVGGFENRRENRFGLKDRFASCVQN